MVNYYKILGIENFSEISVVKEVYKDKIRMYHPDLNPSDEAAEISKWLNEAKGILTDPEKKPVYDQQLKMAYAIEIQRLKEKSTLPPVPIWKARKKRLEAEKLREKQRFIRRNEKFPYRWRIGLLISGMLLGLVLMHYNYFINFDGVEMFYSVLGAIGFIVCLFALSNQVFTFYWVRSVDRAIRFNYEKWIGRFVVILFLFGPSTVMVINEYKKQHELSTDYRYLIAELETERRSPGAYIYSYTVEGNTYVKRKRHKDGFFVIMGPNQILIKYALKNPKISQAILEDW